MSHLDLDRYNDRQREAVTCTEGPLLVLAGAGSGKTSTMTGRIAYLLERGVNPYNILAVTFTNKAAAEMRSRVEALTEESAAREMWIMTFHAMCLRLLRIHGDVLGYDRNFVIYDTGDQKTLVKRILKELNLNEKEFSPAYMMSVISDNKEKEISPQGYRQGTEENYKTKAVYSVYSRYEETLKANNAMDFDDLLLNGVRLFEKDPRVLEKYRDRFRYIMVDEYQDTNYIQYKLIKMMAGGHHNLCVVGDDDQCIYQWRGADIRNILDFEKDFPEAKVIKLEQNYRSAGNILAAAHSVIENNRGRKAKKLWTEKDAGHKITYYRADSEKDEAYFTAREIELLKTGDRGYRDFAVLYRTNAQSRPFEEMFSRMEIPYRILSGLRYYDRKEIKDMLAYMRLVVNPKDDLSLRRIINEPKRGMGEKSVEKLAAFAMIKGETMIEALLDPEVQDTLPGKGRESIVRMAESIAQCRSERENLRVSDIYDLLLVNTGYMEALEKSGASEDETRIENLMEFKSVIYDYEEGAYREGKNPDIEEFMENIALMADVDNLDENADAVVLMTMHSAKGLEFPVVFMPGMEDGLFPGHRAFDSVSAMEEERRLCYVGMTRAKERLILSGAQVRTMYGRSDWTRESLFLRELDPKLVEGDGIYKPKSMRAGGPGVDTGSLDGYSARDKDYFNPYEKMAAEAAKAGLRSDSKACNSLGSSISNTKKRVRDAAMSAGGDFQPGDTVEHGKFGRGMVVEQDEKTLTVIFDSAGRKKLAKGIAPIRKVD